MLSTVGSKHRAKLLLRQSIYCSSCLRLIFQKQQSTHKMRLIKKFKNISPVSAMQPEMNSRHYCRTRRPNGFTRAVQSHGIHLHTAWIPGCWCDLNLIQIAIKHHAAVVNFWAKHFIFKLRPRVLRDKTMRIKEKTTNHRNEQQQSFDRSNWARERANTAGVCGSAASETYVILSAMTLLECLHAIAHERLVYRKTTSGDQEQNTAVSLLDAEQLTERSTASSQGCFH
jgi:hypothetical protein